eukprot:Awhi_evm1s1665
MEKASEDRVEKMLTPKSGEILLDFGLNDVNPLNKPVEKTMSSPQLNLRTAEDAQKRFERHPRPKKTRSVRFDNKVHIHEFLQQTPAVDDFYVVAQM